MIVNAMRKPLNQAKHGSKGPAPLHERWCRRLTAQSAHDACTYHTAVCSWTVTVEGTHARWAIAACASEATSSTGPARPERGTCPW